MGWPWLNPAQVQAESEQVRTRDQARENSEVMALYDEHAADMLRFALHSTGSREAARDALQEAFAALVGQIRVGNRPEDAKEFLYHSLLDALRMRTADAEPTGELAAPVSDKPDFDAPLRAAEVQRRLSRISSPREYEMLRMRAEGFSYHEIASVLAIHPGTVASTLARAFRKVRKAFEVEHL